MNSQMKRYLQSPEGPLVWELPSAWSVGCGALLTRDAFIRGRSPKPVVWGFLCRSHPGGLNHGSGLNL